MLLLTVFAEKNIIIETWVNLFSVIFVECSRFVFLLCVDHSEHTVARYAPNDGVVTTLLFCFMHLSNNIYLCLFSDIFIQELLSLRQGKYTRLLCWAFIGLAC